MKIRIHKQLTEKKKKNLSVTPWGGVVLLRILDGGDVRPGSPNPYAISHQKMSFSTPVFRPDL